MPLTTAPVAPGALSPRRPVPASIARPEYVDQPAPAKFTGSEVKDAETIEAMRVAGRIAANAMAAAAAVTDATYLVGDVDEESRLLVERTHEAMMRGIRAAVPGRAVNVIGRVIESYAKRFGYGVVRDFTGHGIGSAFHSGLIIPHYDAAPAYDTIIEAGMTFTVEPMLNLGTAEWEMWDDRWTVVTKDRRRSAQFEHTILVTDHGPEILTQGDAA